MLVTLLLENKIPNKRKVGRISSVLRILRVIKEIEEEVLSDYKNRPSSPVGYPKESQCPIDATEKGKGKERESRRILEIKDTQEFNYKLFNNDFIKNSRALYNDVKLLITKKNNTVDKVYELQ